MCDAIFRSTPATVVVQPEKVPEPQKAPEPEKAAELLKPVVVVAEQPRLEFVTHDRPYDTDLYEMFPLTGDVVFRSALFPRLYAILAPQARLQVIRAHARNHALVPRHWILETFRHAWRRDSKHWFIVLPKAEGAVWHQHAAEEAQKVAAQQAQACLRRKMASDDYQCYIHALSTVLGDEADGEQEGQPS